mmetsp:Transcript_60915/g.178070  ORF Transcript_60915/g.178070 Transcript_60915/m.178070 type:complete len:205 (+) Transcript_60915:42-656(+)
MGAHGSTQCFRRPNVAEFAMVSVNLNVYNIGTSKGLKALNAVLRPLGTGIYHCGVQVHGVEWSYSDTETGLGDGIFSCAPQKCPDHSFYEAVPLGWSGASEREVIWIIKILKSTWTADNYDLLRRNCCHFCDELCRRLHVDSVPDWVTSSARGAGAAIAPAGGFMCCSSTQRGMAPRVVDVMPGPEEVTVPLDGFEPAAHVCVH